MNIVIQADIMDLTGMSVVIGRPKEQLMCLFFRLNGQWLANGGYPRNLVRDRREELGQFTDFADALLQQ